MWYITEQLDEVDCPAEKRALAESLLSKFDYPGSCEIPSGYCNPGDYDWGTEEEISRTLEGQSKFYEEMAKIFGDSPPARLTKLKSRFERNREQMMHLTRLKLKERMALPMSDFFPYFDDFDAAIRNSGEYMHVYFGEMPLKSLRFTPELVGSGGCADVYKVKHDSGKNFALKLFHTGHKLTRYDRIEGEQVGSIGTIKKRIHSLKETLSSSFFASPRYVPDGWQNLWYVMDFFEGEDVRKLLLNGKLTKSPNLVGRILSTYADMLCFVHSRNTVVCDNAWSNVLANDSEVKLCDYDFFMKIDEQGKFKPMHIIYASREHYLEDDLKFSSDLESFALMIDHLINGKPFIKEDYNLRKENRELARKNSRKYHPNGNMPRRMAQVVAPLINYPRNEFITAQDFREAIRLDFGI